MERRNSFVRCLMVGVVGGLLVLGGGCGDNGISTISNVEGENIFSPNNYETRILEELGKSEWVPVIVDLNDEHNLAINYTDPEEKRIAVMEQKKKINEITIESVLLTLSNEDFRLRQKYLGDNGFSGDISNQGFAKLTKEHKVKMIYFGETQELFKKGVK